MSSPKVAHVVIVDKAPRNLMTGQTLYREELYGA